MYIYLDKRSRGWEDKRGTMLRAKALKTRARDSGPEEEVIGF